jgi:ribose transport system substrate-binding protein
MSTLDSENQVQELNAAEGWMKANGIKYTIVDRQANGGDPNRSADITTAMIQAHPDMNAIMNVEAGGQPGIGKALQELGMTNKIIAIGMDGTDENLDTIRAGRITGVMAQNTYRWGYDTGKLTYMAIKGEKVPSITDSGVTFIDKSNVDTYSAMSK